MDKPLGFMGSAIGSKPDSGESSKSENSERTVAAFAAGTPGAVPALDPIADLAYRKDVSMNSWFAIGHFEHEGQKLNFLYHVLISPRLDGSLFQQGAISITNETTSQYVGSDVITAFSPCAMPENGVALQLPNGSIIGDFNDLRVAGQLEGGSFSMRMRAESPVIFNCGTGVFPMLGMTVHQYSIPRLKTEGTITLGDRTYEVDGVSWFDRQWQDMIIQQGQSPIWAWMDINLDNGDAISLWSFQEPSLNNREIAWATILHSDGSQTVTPIEPLSVSARDFWSSPAGAKYPTRWTVRIPQFNATLDVTPKPREQEIASQRPMLNKYEGASEITGHYKGLAAQGFGYVELVGQWK